MNTRLSISACLLLASAVAAGPPTAGPIRSAQLLLKLSDEIAHVPDATRLSVPDVPAGLNELGKRFAGAGLRRLYRRPRRFMNAVAIRRGLDRIVCISLDPRADIQRAIEAYAGLGFFEYVEADGFCVPHALDTVAPNDRNFARQWWLHNDGTFNWLGDYIFVDDVDIDMVEAWPYAQGDSSVIVAIIDSGCKKDHPEFAGRFWTNPDEIAGNGIDDDRNQYVDDIWGWDFVDNDNTPQDDVGHGTAVAGFVAAQGMNGIGFAGVDWNCKLMVLKVINVDPVGNEGASFGDMFEAIVYAADHGADVINLSLGTDRNSSTVRTAMDYAVSRGCIIVASAGNDNASPISFPARYEKAIAVGSSDPDDKRTTSFLYRSPTSGSNYGVDLDVVAPGNFVYFLLHDNDTAFDHASGGTSFAAPQVAGLAALLRGQDSTRSVDQIREIIEETADDQVGDPAEDVAGWDQYHGHGRINAFRAVTYGMTLARESRSTAASRGRARARLNRGILTVELPHAFGEEDRAEVVLYNASGRSLVKTSAATTDGVLRVRIGHAPGVALFSVKLQSGSYRGRFISM